MDAEPSLWGEPLEALIKMSAMADYAALLRKRAKAERDPRGRVWREQMAAEVERRNLSIGIRPLPEDDYDSWAEVPGQ